MANKNDSGAVAKVLAVLIVVGLGIFIFHIISSTVKGVTTSDNRPTKIKTQPDALMGQSVRDGKFSFVIKSIQCGATTIGDSVSTDTALGKFCIVRLSVTNIGKVANTVDTSSQKLLDSNGTRYDAQFSAGANLPGNSEFEGMNLNPGLSVSGAIVFDVPKTLIPVTLEVHDGSFSGGKQVSLTSKK